jgi:hypothetical protein
MKSSVLESFAAETLVKGADLWRIFGFGDPLKLEWFNRPSNYKLATWN